MTEAWIDEATRLVAAADERGLTVRLLGGAAIRIKVPEWSGREASSRPDIDLVVRRPERAALSNLLESEGWVGDRMQNALTADQQLYFAHPDGGPSVDVIVDRLAMCHTLDLRDRLQLDWPTIPSADLLLSKLQIVRLNRKDALDVLALVSARALVDADGSGISMRRILAITSSDWGWWRTVTGNLERLSEVATDRSAETALISEKLATAADRLHALAEAIADAPKSMRWRARALVGERVQWYDEPEEESHA